MPFIVLRGLFVVLLLSAWGCGFFTSSRPSEPTEPGDESPAPAPAARLSVERHAGYGAAWDDAYEVILDARLQAFARLGVTRVVLKPHAVRGTIFPHIVRVQLHFEDGDSESIAVVADGRLLERSAGPDGLTTYLAGLGFPRKLPPATLFTDLVCYFEGVIAEREPWCSAVGEAPRADARVAMTSDGAALVLERALAPSSGERGVQRRDEPGEVPHRLVLRFDAEARFTVLPFRRRSNGSWQPVPLE